MPPADAVPEDAVPPGAAPEGAPPEGAAAPGAGLAMRMPRLGPATPAPVGARAFTIASEFGLAVCAQLGLVRAAPAPTSATATSMRRLRRIVQLPWAY